MKLLAIGTDPEFFLKNEDGKIVSAIGKVGGTKRKPRPIKELGKGFAVQEDNVLLEYNLPPAKSWANWMKYHKVMLDYLVHYLGKINLTMSDKASHSMDDDELTHPKAFVFGCDPDFNVWTMQWNKKPECTDPNLRSAGGHVHIAYENPNPMDSVKLGRLLDLFIGAPLAAKDPDKNRRLLYGKAGAIRFKKYGLEYRTPSNYWLLTEHNTEGMYHNVRQAVVSFEFFDNYSELASLAAKFVNGELETHPQGFGEFA